MTLFDELFFPQLKKYSLGSVFEILVPNFEPITIGLFLEKKVLQGKKNYLLGEIRLFSLDFIYENRGRAGLCWLIQAV